MKRPALAFALALATTLAAARADFEIVQKLEGVPGMGDTEITMKMKGDKIRVDTGMGTSVILETVSGDMTSLMHAQKMAMSIPGKQVKAMAEAAAKSEGAANNEKSKLVATGKKDKINGYDAEEYTLFGGPSETATTIWVAKDFPNAKKLLEALEKLQTSSIGATTQAFNLKASAYPGMPIRSVSTVNGQQITMTLVSATEKPVPTSEFEVPSAYQKIAMPEMPAAPAAP